MSQTAQEIQKDREKKNSDFLQAVNKFYFEQIKAANDIEKKEKRNLSFEATDANENMVVDDGIAINDWYVDDEFDNENFKMLEDVKIYIGHLIKKTIQNKKIQISFKTTAVEECFQEQKIELIEQEPYILDKILMTSTTFNNDTLQKKKTRQKKLCELSIISNTSMEMTKTTIKGLSS